MSSSIRIISTNVQGLNSNEKKSMLLEELKQRNIDIAVISDARIGETDVNLLRQNDDYHCIYTKHYCSVQRGSNPLEKTKFNYN